jgi:hypothetical protein
MIAVRHRAALFSTTASTIVALTTTLVAMGAPAAAAVPGFEVNITELPGTLAVGAGPGTIEVVASTNVGRGCQKVRWSMVMRTEQVGLEEVSIERIEETGAFPVQVQANGDTARFTDVGFDPGALCRGRTVTARYQVSLGGGATDGRIVFQAEAYDTNERLLQLATASSQVVNGAQAAPPSPTEEALPSPSATEPTDDESAAVEDPDGTPTPDEPSPTSGAIAAVPAAAGGTPSLLGVGLIVGAVLIFLGVGLLLRLRLRSRGLKGSPTEAWQPAP